MNDSSVGEEGYGSQGIKLLFGVLILASLFGCSSRVDEIKCYSGGQLIYQGKSSRRIKVRNFGRSIYITDLKDRKRRLINSDCIITKDVGY